MPNSWLTVSLNPEPTTLYSTLLTRTSRSGSPLFFENFSVMDTMDLITDPCSKTKGKAPPTNENRNIEKDKEPRFPIDLATMHNTKRISRKRSRTRVGAGPCLSMDLRLDDASPNSRCFPSSRHPYCSDPFTLLYKIDLVWLSEQINQSVELTKDLYLNDINRNNHTNQSYSFDFMKLLVDFNLIMMRMTSLPINVSRIISKFCLVFSPSVKGLMKLDMRFVKGEAPSDLEINYEHARTSVGFCDPSLLNFTCNCGSLSVLVKDAFAPNDHGANSYESSENPNRSEMGNDHKPNPLTMYLNPKGTDYLCRSLRLIFKNHFRYDSPAPALTVWMYWLLWFSCFSPRKWILELDVHPFNDSIDNEQHIYDNIAKNNSMKIHSVEDNCSWESPVVIRSQEEDDLSLEGLKILILYYPRKVSALSIEVRIHEKMKNLTCFWYLISIEPISKCSSFNAFLINSKIIIDPSLIFIVLIYAPLSGPHAGLLLPFYAINQTTALLVLALEMTKRKTCTYRVYHYVVISTPLDFFHAPKIDHLECLTIDFPFDFDTTVHRNFVIDETFCFSTNFSLSVCVLLTLCVSVIQADLVEKPEKEKMQKRRMKTKSKESITRHNEEHTVLMSPTSQALVTKAQDTIKSIQKNKRRNKKYNTLDNIGTEPRLKESDYMKKDLTKKLVTQGPYFLHRQQIFGVGCLCLLPFPFFFYLSLFSFGSERTCYCNRHRDGVFAAFIQCDVFFVDEQCRHLCCSSSATTTMFCLRIAFEPTMIPPNQRLNPKIMLNPQVHTKQFQPSCLLVELSWVFSFWLSLGICCILEMVQTIFSIDQLV